jgi:hypothetical protein
MNKLINKYFGDGIKPKCILSENATQFARPLRADNCNNREMTFDLLLFSIQSRALASGMCVNCPNFADLLQ